jgi:hypothetical protein
MYNQGSLMKADKVISDNQIVVFVVPRAKYSSKLIDISAAASKKGVCVASLNKPYNVIGAALQKKKIDLKKVVFVDTVSGDLKTEKGYAVIHVSSPRALTELSIAMNKALGKTDIIVFDSLSNLIVNTDSATAIKFVHSIVTKIRAKKKKCVFLCLKEDSKSSLMNDVSMFVDKVTMA